MAQDRWAVEPTLTLILAKLHTISPDNRALIPFATSLECQLWHIDIMVKDDTTEWDIHSEAPTLRLALRRAYRGLNNWRAIVVPIETEAHTL